MGIALAGVYWLLNGRKIKLPKNDEAVVTWEEFIKSSKNNKLY